MLELNKIYCGKSETILKTFPDSSVDLCITSPPYNLKIKYDNYTDELDWQEYYKWCEQWLREVFRVLKNDGRLVLNHYFSFGNAEKRLYPLFTLNGISENIGFKHHSVMFWNDITVCKKTAWGSWCSASSPYINSPFEGFLVLYKNQWKKEIKGIDTITKEDFMKMCYGIINDSPSRDDNHPAPFPLKTAKLFVEGLSFKNDIVLDPFCGRGTTLIAAKLTNRQYIGIDLSPVYCKLSESGIYTAYQSKSAEGLI